MGAEDQSVRSLVGMVQSGTLRLPEMQRDYVWTATKVRDLFDSLYRGYPSGVILAWEPSEAEDAEVRTREFATSSGTSGRRSLLLLDGQQRLTSLYAVLEGMPVKVKNYQRPIELLFNLDHPDELVSVTEVGKEDAADEEELSVAEKSRRRAFVVATKQLASQPQWVPVVDIFRGDAMDLLEAKGYEIATMDRELRRKYASRLAAVKAIEHYNFRVEILERDKSYQEVTEIFVRVNSSGARLKSSDLALAQITAVWPGSLAIFTDYEEATRARGFAIDVGNILRTLLALLTDQSRFNRLGRPARQDLEAAWVRTKKALDHAHNLLVNDFGIESPVALTSPLLVVATAYWADWLDYIVSDDEKTAFKRWALIANAKARYTRGSSETILDQDLAEIRAGGGGSGLIQRLLAQVGRLDFTPDELEGRRTNSGAFKTLFLALRAEGAVDWETKLRISAKHQGKADAIQYHHIFPEAYLKEVRADLKPSARNDVANLAMIGARTNQQISKTAPSVYREQYNQGVLADHLVDFSGELDQPDNYEKFLARRRAAIANTLNRFLGVEDR